MDNQTWPPSPLAPQPEQTKATPSRAVTSFIWADAILGFPSGFIFGVALFISLTIVMMIIIPPMTYAKMVIVWAIASGVSALLGIIIWRRWPILGAWVTVGAELPLLVWLMIMSSLRYM